jgi:hypothetical protein
VSHGFYVHPSTTPEALAFCHAILEPQHCTVVQPGTHHWSIFADLCRKSRATGNLVQDAWLAALAIESGCEWVTTEARQPLRAPDRPETKGIAPSPAPRPHFAKVRIAVPGVYQI